MNKIIQFFKEAKIEMQKANWPSKQQTINYTLIVIGVSVAIALFLGGLDFLFKNILGLFIK